MMTSLNAIEQLADGGGGVLITGANGHLGTRLLRQLRNARAPQVRALVRSASAAARLEGLVDSVIEGSYIDAQVLERALDGCDRVVHLVGIIKENRTNSFASAHVETTRTLVTAAERCGVERIVYLSIVGSSVENANPCLASKAEAEGLLSDSSVPATVFRVPMVLGEGDYASQALRRRALAKPAWVFRAESIEQPIYAGDVLDAVLRALVAKDEADRLYELPGPETLSRRALIERAATILGAHVRVRSLPMALGYGLAGVAELLSANPPVTRAMLGVLDHDDRASNGAAVAELGLELTELDEILRRCLEPAVG